MKQLLQTLTELLTPTRQPPHDGPLGENEMRGKLELYRDRSQHRRFAARYEDLLN